MTVEQLSETMSSEELSEWIAFDNFHEPIGQRWLQTGTITAAILAPHSKKGQQPKPEDFIPMRRMPMSQEEMAAELQKLKKLTGKDK